MRLDLCSLQNGLYELALTDKDMQVRFGLDSPVQLILCISAQFYIQLVHADCGQRSRRINDAF